MLISLVLGFFLIVQSADLPLADLQPGTPILVQGNLTLTNGMWKFHKKNQYRDQGYSYGWSQKLLPPEEGECKVSLWKFNQDQKAQENLSLNSGDLIISEAPSQSLMAQKASKKRRILFPPWPENYEWLESLTGYTEVSFYLPVKTKDGKKEGSISCRYFTKSPPKGLLSTSLLAKKTHSLLKVGSRPIKEGKAPRNKPLSREDTSGKGESRPGL